MGYQWRKKTNLDRVLAQDMISIREAINNEYTVRQLPVPSWTSTIEVYDDVSTDDVNEAYTFITVIEPFTCLSVHSTQNVVVNSSVNDAIRQR